MFDKLRKTLKGVTKSIVEKDLTKSDIDDILDTLELSLLQSDVAIEVIESINESLKRRLVGTKVGKKEVGKFVKGALRESISAQFEDDAIDVIEQIRRKNAAGLPYLIVFLGINGTGKTTTLAKFAYLLKQNRITVTVAASDTFRAGAIEQIKEHTDNLQIKLIAQNYNSDPAAVARDAMLYARSHKVNCVLVDTAGRIQTSSNLMQQIEKITKVTNPDLKIFVGDSLAGNDVVSQAREFYRYTKFDCSILTKNDADAKGGAALSIAKVTSRPILFLGVGQEYPDLQRFSKENFLDTILGDVGKVDSTMSSRIHEKVNVKDPILDEIDEADRMQYYKLHKIPATEEMSVNLAEQIQTWVQQGRRGAKPKDKSQKSEFTSDTDSKDSQDIAEAKKSEMTKEVEASPKKTKDEPESDADPFEGISSDDIAVYSDVYDIPPPETDREAAKTAAAIKQWIKRGRPSPDDMETKQEIESEPEAIPKTDDVVETIPEDTPESVQELEVKSEDDAKAVPENKPEAESSTDPFEGISSNDIAIYSDVYDIPPPETDREAAKTAAAIKQWIKRGRPSPEDIETKQEIESEPEVMPKTDDVVEAIPEDTPEAMPKDKPKKKRRFFGMFKK